MHYITSKEQIEQAIDAINTGDTAAARMLQGLLARPTDTNTPDTQ
jgi:hypothetical protein